MSSEVLRVGGVLSRSTSEFTVCEPFVVERFLRVGDCRRKWMVIHDTPPSGQTRPAVKPSAWSHGHTVIQANRPMEILFG